MKCLPRCGLHPMLPAVLALCILPALAAAADDPLLRNVAVRGDLQNCRIQFERHKTGHVVFLGGSITEMNGYRPLVAADLEKRFPETKFTFTNAGIASTCSTTGAFRLTEDVLRHGPVDLLFVEFAVNDDQDAHHSLAASRRGMEGIVRQTLTHNPCTDIVMTYFVNPEMLELTQRGERPIPVVAHDQVSEHYNINTIVLTQELADRIKQGTCSWEKYGGTHPGPAGNAIPAAMIDSLFAKHAAVPLPENAFKTPRELPQALDPQSYDQGRFLADDAVTLGPGWKRETPNWKEIPGSFRSRFADEKLYVSGTPGSELTVRFTGRGLGVYVLAGPDAGRLTCRIDGREVETVDLFHHHSAGLHYPRTVMLATDLSPGPHTATITLAAPSADRPSNHPGNAARILRFTAN